MDNITYEQLHDTTIPAFRDEDGDFFVRRSDGDFYLVLSNGRTGSEPWTANAVGTEKLEPYFGVIPTEAGDTPAPEIADLGMATVIIPQAEYDALIDVVNREAELQEVPRAVVLTEAAGLITGDRNKTYGSPTQNFSTTAEIWNALLAHKLKPGERVEPYEVGSLMIGLKLARTVADAKRDSWVDIAGYAGCAWECQDSDEALAESEGLDPNG